MNIGDVVYLKSDKEKQNPLTITHKEVKLIESTYEQSIQSIEMITVAWFDSKGLLFSQSLPLICFVLA